VRETSESGEVIYEDLAKHFGISVNGARKKFSPIVEERPSSKRFKEALED